MEPSSEREGTKTAGVNSFGDPTEASVVACETRPGRTVFTERGNCDAWIATSLVIEPVD